MGLQPCPPCWRPNLMVCLWHRCRNVLGPPSTSGESGCYLISTREGDLHLHGPQALDSMQSALLLLVPQRYWDPPRPHQFFAVKGCPKLTFSFRVEFTQPSPLLRSPLWCLLHLLMHVVRPSPGSTSCLLTASLSLPKRHNLAQILHSTAGQGKCICASTSAPHSCRIWPPAWQEFQLLWT